VAIQILGLKISKQKNKKEKLTYWEYVYYKKYEENGIRKPGMV